MRVTSSLISLKVSTPQKKVPAWCFHSRQEPIAGKSTNPRGESADIILLSRHGNKLSQSASEELMPQWMVVNKDTTSKSAEKTCLLGAQPQGNISVLLSTLRLRGHLKRGSRRIVGDRWRQSRVSCVFWQHRALALPLISRSSRTRSDQGALQLGQGFVFSLAFF